MTSTSEPLAFRLYLESKLWYRVHVYGIDKICEPFMYMEVACNVSNSEVRVWKKYCSWLKGIRIGRRFFLSIVIILTHSQKVLRMLYYIQLPINCVEIKCLWSWIIHCPSWQMTHVLTGCLFIAVHWVLW